MFHILFKLNHIKLFQLKIQLQKPNTKECLRPYKMEMDGVQYNALQCTCIFSFVYGNEGILR